MQAAYPAFNPPRTSSTWVVLLRCEWACRRIIKGEVGEVAASVWLHSALCTKLPVSRESLTFCFLPSFPSILCLPYALFSFLASLSVSAPSLSQFERSGSQWWFSLAVMCIYTSGLCKVLSPDHFTCWFIQTLWCSYLTTKAVITIRALWRANLLRTGCLKAF